LPAEKLSIGNWEKLSLRHFAAPNARRAGPDSLSLPADLGVDRPQVHIPTAFAHIVSVTDGISKLRPFAADFTNLCHDYSQKVAY
jgi:hypothetical protein